MYLFFDTETTGLPRNWKAPITDSNNWPRLVQIAWLVFDIDGNRIDTQEFIIKPSGFIIPEDASRVHGITTSIALDKGVELITVLNAFNQEIDRANTLVAHNMSFDSKIIGAEMFRKQINTNFNNKQSICTMEASTNFCKIPGNYGFKWPKLSELHMSLFGKDFEEAHNAIADIEATARCFWKLKEMKNIK
jgi:DNA polymerase III subunit epsilon